MKLRSIEAFCAAAEEKRISAAARRMYLSQPSVSKRLSELERETKVALLERSQSGVELTAEGEVFYKQARKVLDEAAVLGSIMRNLGEKRSVKLRFAACTSVGERLLPEWLWSFRQQMPESIPTLFMGNDPRIINLVKSGDAPLGIVASDECYDDFESEAILYDELVVAVASTHPWAHQRVGPEDLSTKAFVSREKGSMIRALVERKLEEIDEHVNLNVQMELGSITAIKKVVEEGWAFSIFSRANLQRNLRTGSMVEVKGFSIPCSFKLIRQTTANLNLAEQGFYEFLLKMHKLGSDSPVFGTPETGAEHPLASKKGRERPAQGIYLPTSPELLNSTPPLPIVIHR